MPKRLYRILSHRLPAFAWTLFILILISIPGKMLPNENQFSIPQFDKLIHIILFGSFVFLWSFYFYAKGGSPGLNKTFLRITIIACLYGYATELIQKYFIPNRDYDIHDIVADVIGAFLGFIIVRMTMRNPDGPVQ